MASASQARPDATTEAPDHVIERHHSPRDKRGRPPRRFVVIDGGEVDCVHEGQVLTAAAVVAELRREAVMLDADAVAGDGQGSGRIVDQAVFDADTGRLVAITRRLNDGRGGFASFILDDGVFPVRPGDDIHSVDVIAEPAPEPHRVAGIPVADEASPLARLARSFEETLTLAAERESIARQATTETERREKEALSGLSLNYYDIAASALLGAMLATETPLVRVGDYVYGHADMVDHPDLPDRPGSLLRFRLD